MSRITTTKPSAISAEMVIRALQDATPTAYATRDDMHRDTWTTEHQARALVYLCSETADATPQEYWEEQQFNADGIREQRHCGILPGDHDIRARNGCRRSRDLNTKSHRKIGSSILPLLRDHYRGDRSQPPLQADDQRLAHHSAAYHRDACHAYSLH